MANDLKRLTFAIAFVSAILGSQPVHATSTALRNSKESCTRQNNDSAALGPQRRQEPTSICFAFSSADMISHKLGRRVSAYDIAAQYYLSDVERLRAFPDPEVQRSLRETQFFEGVRTPNESQPQLNRNRILTSEGLFYGGGSDEHAMILANVNGVCPVENIPEGPHEFANFLKGVTKLARKMVSERSSAPSNESVGDVRDPVAQIQARAYQRYIQERCPRRIPVSQAITPHALYASAEIDSLEAYEQATKGNATQKERFRQMMLKEVDRVLDSGAIPSIGFNHAKFVYGKGLSDHSAVVVAREFRGGRCMYLLRTHYDCKKHYLAKFRPQCDLNNRGLWLAEDEIAGLYGVTSLAPPTATADRSSAGRSSTPTVDR